MKQRWPAVALAALIVILAPGLEPYEAAAQVLKARPAAPVIVSGVNSGMPVVGPSLTPLNMGAAAPVFEFSPMPSVPELALSPAETALEILEVDQAQVQEVLEAASSNSSPAEGLSRGSAVPFERSSSKIKGGESVFVQDGSWAPAAPKMRAALQMAAKADGLERAGAGHAENHAPAITPENAEKHGEALRRVLGVGAFFLAIELVGSMMTGSLSLKADAMHLGADLSITAAALFSSWISRRPPDARRTFGLLKVEAVTGLLSAVAIAAMGSHMLFEAVPRLWAPVEVPGLSTILLALAGLASNSISTWILYRYQAESLSLKGAFLHAMIDAIGSLGVIAAGLMMFYGGWFIADPIISLAIVGLIFFTTWNLAKRSLNVLIDAAPPGLDMRALKADLLALSDVVGIDDFHVWSLNSSQTIATVSLDVKPGGDADKALKAARALLLEKYKIGHATVQVESSGR